jgi:ATP-dependent Clp protease adapter protein ClpS
MTETASDILSTDFPRLPGYVRVARIGGASLDLHWTCILGGIVLSAAGEFRPRLLLPLIAGCLLVVLVHELGHALAARALGLKVFGIRLRGMGGHCVTSLPIGARATLILFSAGVLAQLALLAAALGAGMGLHGLHGRHGTTLGAFAFAFVFGNALTIVASLLPWTDRDGLRSDGRVLMQLVIDRWHGRTIVGGSLPAMNPSTQSPVFPPDTALLDKPDLVPAGFVHGVEILNDRHTPLAFVVDALHLHLGLSGRQAWLDAIAIHNRGGLLRPLPTREDAERAAGAMAAAAAAAGHAFVCRAVSIAQARPPSAAPA